jgi:inositol 1,4,5-triphosphate receptor type 3
LGEVDENMCINLIQCWMNVMNIGVRGGELFKIISYNNTNYYTKIFFFNQLFFILIALVMLNIFLGIIVDTFADLRDKKNEFDYDSNDVCFICQLTRANSIQKDIDFNKHIQTDHLLWNYVNFLVYLHVNNPMDFNEVELDALRKIRQHDINWIPLEKSESDKDE